MKTLGSQYTGVDFCNPYFQPMYKYKLMAWCKTEVSLTHWAQVTHICVGKLTIIGSDNGLSPGRCQPIIWTNAGILLIEPLGTNFSEILIGIQILSFKKMRLKMSSAKWRPFCLGLNVLKLTHCSLVMPYGLTVPSHCLKQCWLFINGVL